MKKCLKRTKNIKNHKHTKNRIIIHVVCQIERGQAFCQFWAIFVPLPQFWPKKSKCSKNEKKHQEILLFYILLGV